MKIIVDIKNYTPFEYHPFLKRGVECPRPKETPYEVGQVVILNDSKSAAVVLGCIDSENDLSLRLDLCGMTEFDTFRPATKEDLSNPEIEFMDKLRAECEGKNVHYDWKTYELTITEKDDL